MFFIEIFIYFFIFYLFLKVHRPGRKTSGFRTVRILKICRTSGLDLMSGRALAKNVIIKIETEIEAGRENSINLDHKKIKYPLRNRQRNN